MSEIIQTWLMKRLGFVAQITPESIATLAKDGKLFAELLYNYNIITYEQFVTIGSKDDPDRALENLETINSWLKPIGISCSHEKLFNISRAKAPAALRLFYQLYLNLHDKDTMHFISETLRKQKLEPPHPLFKVKRVRESCAENDEPCDNPNCKPLIDKRDIVEWHKHRYEALLERCRATRERYSKFLQQQFDHTEVEKVAELKGRKKESDKEALMELNRKYLIPKNCGYQTLVQEQQKILEAEPFQPDPQKSKEIVDKIKQKHRKEAEDRAKKVKEEKALLLDLWEKLVTDQERDFGRTISTKMIKQSSYEKQMATKMFEVRHQKEVMMENKRVAEQEYLKQRENEFIETVFYREKSNCDRRDSYYLERDRTIELHRRLFEQKKRIKAEAHESMCRGIVEDIVALSLKHAEFKANYDMDVPRRVEKNWYDLFIKEQPIFDILPHTEDIVQECLDDLPSFYEEIYSREIMRQNALDDKEFEDYCEYKWPWDLEEHELYDEERLQIINLGMNVLGHIVGRVLLAKYPYPPQPEKPTLPPVTIAACVNGIQDITIRPALQKLLDKRKVAVIEMQDAINYCLECYRDETTTEVAEQTLVEETEQALEDMKNKAKGKQPKNKKGPPKKGEKKKSKKGEAVEDDNISLFDLNLHIDRQCQTPRIFPCEEIQLTQRAKLGEEAFKVLNLGHALDDHLLVAMFLEYLHTLSHVEGWALINFPSSMEQAVILEESLTNKKVPGVTVQSPSNSVANLIHLEERRRSIKDEYAHLRQSRLLVDPKPTIEDVNAYDTFFTAFINIIPDDLEEGLDGRVITLKIIEDLEGEKVNPLNKFYTEQGCNYSLYYKIFDFSTIKHLAKLIIGDYSLPPKTSVELFGDTVYYLENSLPDTKGATGKESKAVKEGDKKKKPIIKKTVKEPASPSTPGTPKGGKKGKKNVIPEVVIVREDKETQYPEPEQEVIEIFVEPKPPPKAGEEDWVYVDVYIPSYVLEIFGTLWENTEDVYMIDLKQLFFVRRITMNVVIPYMNYMKEHMREFIARPDDRQSYMSKFQVMYNEIDADMRDDEEVKAELHCRIVEFREKLWQMCDERMKESENERRRLIQDNWLATQVYELTNNYIVQFQTEMDRFVDTLQLITDYYTACVTKAPAKDVHLQKKPLDKLEIGSYSDIAAEALIWMEAVSELMTNVDSIPENTPFHQCIENNVTTAMAFIDQTLATANSVVGKIGSSMGPTVEGKPAKKKGKEAVPFWEPDPAVKEVAANLLEEWKCVLNGEVQRVKLRIELMRGVALWDVHDMFSCGQKTFHGLYYEIKERYEREVESVRTACDVLSRAVEAETTIQPQMVLDGDKFFIDPEIILFPDPPIIPEPVDLDPPKEDAFTLSQLNALSDMFMDLAPKGYLPERAFLYLIQGIIELNAEDGRPPMLPAIWRKLTPEQSTELFREMFGAAEFVDWRDFILYNLNINFPSEDDMLALRDKFQRRDPDNTELVRDYQLGEVKFWFEKVFWKEDEQELYRIKTTKELLFKLFKTSEDTLNYTALLLAFCKDTNPAAGMAKALALSLGKPVCWDNTIGENFVEAVRYKRVQHELQKLEEQKQHEENLEDATKLVEEIIDYTVHTCDSVVIEDYTSENDVEEPSKDLQTTSSNTLPTSEGSGIISIFTNVSIAFEAVEDTSRIYFLPFEPVLKVVSAALPWHVLVQYSGGETFRRRLEAIYDKCKSAEFHDAVLTHEFLNCPELGEIFQYVSRFTSVKPAHIIKKLIQDDNKT